MHSMRIPSLDNKFMYPENMIDNEGYVNTIHDKIQSGIRAYCATSTLLRSNLIGDNGKMKTCKTLVRPLT